MTKGFDHITAGFPARFDKIAEKVSEWPLTYRCADCRDKGYRLRTDADGLVWGSVCDCEKGQCIKQSEKIMAAKEAIAEAKRRKQNNYRNETIMEQAEKILDDKPEDEDLPF